MSIQRVPRVEFILENPPVRMARKALIAMLQRHLAKRFGQVRLFGIFLFPGSMLKLNVSGEDFVVGIKPTRWEGYKDQGWYMAVDPLEFASKSEEWKYAEGLKLISGEIQALLTGTLGVTRMRWFFEDWDMKRPGVENPAELPWGTDADVEGRKIS